MSDANPMLAWYGPEALDGLPGLLKLDPAREAAADDLTFRDAEGLWWRPQRDGSWLRSDGGEWLAGSRPDHLEGVAPLPVGIAAVGAPGGDLPATEPAVTAAPEGLARGIERVVRAYRNGEMVSTMAELVLADWMLLGTDGLLWTVGARSGTWYAYGEGGWESQPGEPDGPFLSGEPAAAVAREAGSPAFRWAAEGPYLPEAISPPWRVPAPPDRPAVPPVRPAAPGATGGLTVPAEGLPGWHEPNAAAETAADLEAGTAVELLERRGAWARVRNPEGQEVWVDGRRLVGADGAHAPPPAVPVEPVAVAAREPIEAATPPAPPIADPSGARPDIILIVAAAAVVVSALLPWRADLPGFDTSAQLFWDGTAYTGGPAIALVMLVVGAAALATVFAPQLRRYRRVAGGIVVLLAVWWQVAVFIDLLDWMDEIRLTLGAMATDEFAAGPWLAMAAGLVLWLRRADT